jgi:hypothetical protein
VLVLASSCTSGSAGGRLKNTPPRVAPRLLLRSPAPRSDCPLSSVEASSVHPSKLSVLMKGHVPTWIPSGFGLVEAFGPYLGFGAHTPGGGAIWVTKDCRSIEVSAYAASLAAAWSLRGAAKGASGCSNAVLGRASCWSIQGPGSQPAITVQTMGLSERETVHIARSMHPTSSPAGLLCPDTLKRQKPRQPTVAGAKSTAVPGRPISLQVCRYGGLSRNPIHSERLTRAAGGVPLDDVHRLQRTLNQLKEVSPTAIFSCPMDTGARDLLRFAYRDGSRVDVMVARSGCSFVANGRAVWFTTPVLRHVIDHIVTR